VFLFAGLLEIGVAHLLLWLFVIHVVAWVVTGLSVASLVWFVGFMVSLSKRPILLDADAVQVRIGVIFDERIPLAEIAGVSNQAPDQGKVLQLSLFPTLYLRLRTQRPLKFGASKPAPYDAIALPMDDPQAFQRALTMRLAA
jgi:hypothetical protein